MKTLPAKDSFTHQTLDELFSTENCTAVVSVDIAGFLKPSLSKTMKIKVPIVVQRCIEFLEKNCTLVVEGIRGKIIYLLQHSPQL